MRMIYLLAKQRKLLQFKSHEILGVLSKSFVYYLQPRHCHKMHVTGASSTALYGNFCQDRWGLETQHR